MERGKVTINTGMTTIKASNTTRIMTKTFADGMASIKAIFRRGSPRRTGCPQGWKNSLCGVGHFRQGFRSESNRVLRTWHGGYLRLLLIPSTY